MISGAKSRGKILLADDSEVNRELLTEMLEDDYEIIEAENGQEAVEYMHNHVSELSLMLLDIVMPVMDGFEVLAYMNKYHWITEVPVVVISSETSPVYIERAYDLGASDFINRPFNFAIVQRRVANVISLYAKQRRLISIVADQIIEREKSNSMMISILSHIVEFRNGESGMHVLHVQVLTELLLNKLMEKTDKYDITPADISLISLASALHDIGKISIPDEILNKPGRFTPEEFEIMKQHSAVGANMLHKVPIYQDEPIIKFAYEICRWHHERYDGHGYPDGLVGESIPISAQIVSLADVYDALTSERCYKKAMSHDEAVKMILDGKCGAFNPLLLECLKEYQEEIDAALTVNSLGNRSKEEVSYIAGDILNQDELTTAERLQWQLDVERTRFQFLSDASADIVFTYLNDPPTLTLSARGAKRLGFERTVIDPRSLLGAESNATVEAAKRINEAINATTQRDTDARLICTLNVDGEDKPCRVEFRSIWTADAIPVLAGAIGRISTGGFFPGEGEMPHPITSAELRNMLTELGRIFDFVQLIDASTDSLYTLGPDGELVEKRFDNTPMLGSTGMSDSTLAIKAINQRTRLTEFTFADDSIYHIIALYIEVDGRPCALELTSVISDETLFAGQGKGALVDFISTHNKKLYTDPLTGVYNRRYYNENLISMNNVEAITMIDMDNLKEVNDTYGHQVGDIAIASVAKAIVSCVRSEDAVIRYGGDEFVVVFHSIPHDIFANRLERIRKKVNTLTFSDYPELKLSVSIGGEYGSGVMSEMLQRADEHCYIAKQQKNCVHID